MRNFRWTRFSPGMLLDKGWGPGRTVSPPRCPGPAPPQPTPPQATPPQATPPQATPPQATPPQATRVLTAAVSSAIAFLASAKYMLVLGL